MLPIAISSSLALLLLMWFWVAGAEEGTGFATQAGCSRCLGSTDYRFPWQQGRDWSLSGSLTLLIQDMPGTGRDVTSHVDCSPVSCPSCPVVISSYLGLLLLMWFWVAGAEEGTGSATWAGCSLGELFTGSLGDRGVTGRCLAALFS